MASAEAAASATGRFAPAPQISEWVAPAHWQCVDFISDLHLSAALPKTFAAWQHYLQNTRADAVFTLGDLFEIWVGDDAVSRPFERACADVLQRAAQRLSLAFMIGNRDFLVGDAFLAQAGMRALRDPTVLTLQGQRLLLTHGDALCLGDIEYQEFRRLVRSSAWQQAVLARTLAERLALAAELRGRSATRGRFDGAADADIDRDHALAWLAAASSSVLIHGHTHRPGSQRMADGIERHVLSDWDLDDALAPRAQVLRWTPHGLTRLSPAQATA